VTKKTKYIIIFSILIIALGLLGVFGWRFYNKQLVNYLIPGVPYYGFYNNYFDANSALTTSAADILGYWGDKVDLPVLFKTLTRDDKDNRLYLSISQLQEFFQKKGYETYSWSSEPGGEIEKIKKFVNSDKKTPVIIFQNQSSDPASLTREFRVVIGVFDDKKKIIVHDHDFGNNYEISYKDFESMFKPDARMILAVWPKADLASRLGGPDYGKEYPKRLQAMDNLGELLVKGANAVKFFNKGEYEQSLKLYQEFIADSKFIHFPPAHRVRFYSFLAQIFLKLNKTDEALKIMNENALPLNHDLSKSFEEWGKPTIRDKFWWPYYVLGLIYEKKGDKVLARKNFEEVLKINPNNKLAQDALVTLQGK